MRKLRLIALALVLCLPLVATPAFSWEFHLTGKMTWDWRGVGQLGQNGFFGPWMMDVVAGAPATAGNNLNFWAGYTAMDYTGMRDIAVTHATTVQDMFMEFEPEIRLNPAIRIRSTMRIGSWRVPEDFLPVTTSMRWGPNSSGTAADWGSTVTPALEGAGAAMVGSLRNGGIVAPGAGIAGVATRTDPPYSTFADGFPLPNAIASKYANSWFTGTQVAFSPIYVQTLWVTANTPWGILVFGKRPAPWGMGLILDGSETSTETLALVAPYGPFRIMFYGCPWQEGDALSGLYGDWYNPYDAGNMRIPRIGAMFTYENGPLSMGALVDYNFRHRDPGGILGYGAAAGAAAGQWYTQRDNVDYFWTVFMKYNTGRVFFNGEIAHYDRARYQRGILFAASVPAVAAPPDARAGTNQAPWYIEDWRYAFEMGCLTGPAKLSILGAWFSGPDRRNGVYIDRSPMQFGNGVLLGTTTVFEPYSKLMVLGYGTGAGAYNLFTKKGGFVDARALGARVDYAVAANLNTYFSAWYAERNSHGYGWGWIRPEWNHRGAVAATQPTGRTSTLNPWDQPLLGALLGGSAYTRFNWADDGTGPAPSIISADLGWELGAGWQWKLLEGLEFTGDFSLWWPGTWFTQACVNRANPAWKPPQVGGAARNDASQWGTANTVIDPVYYWSVKLMTAF